MNLWALIIIILFFVIRSVVKANEQIKKDNQKKGVGDDINRPVENIPNKEITWEDIFFPQKEKSFTSPNPPIPVKKNNTESVKKITFRLP